jgi:hypothetical protein
MSVPSVSANPLGYQGIDLSKNPPVITASRAPSTSDQGYTGQIWVNLLNNFVYMLGGYESGLPDWQLISSGSGSLGSLTGDTGGAIVPSSGNINIVGGDGVEVVGSGSTLTIDVFGATVGTVSTVGATSADVLTLPLGSVASVYSLDILIEGFDSVTPAGAAYAITGGVRTTGSAATLIGSPMIDAFEESALSGASVSLIASANNLLVSVTGVAGKTIAWKARVSYLNG